jgi:hypothetical protein
MPGGLINIATYGSQDLFLTGTPEITFFKIVYRRYTNFSMESIRLKFDDDVYFDKTGTLTIPKTGDLLHKMYLEIVLPEISLDTLIDINCDTYNKYIKNYDILNCFVYITNLSYNYFINTYNLVNITNEQKIDLSKAYINNIFNNNNLYEYCYNLDVSFNIVTTIENILNDTIITNESPISDNYIFSKFFYNQLSLQSIVNKITDSSTYDINVLKGEFDWAIKKINYLLEHYQWLLETEKKNCSRNFKYNFAWVKRLGHSIIDYISINIGGDTIDKHYGEWLDIWYELTSNVNLEESYMKMIGNVPELTDFNDVTKPSYKLLIPLIFWFNRFNGQALPLVALQYHDVQIKVKLRKFSEVAYMDERYISEWLNNNHILLNNVINQNIDNIFSERINNLEVNMLVDFIFLDTKERRKFAQSGHEYLIDIVQSYFDDTDIEEYKKRLEFTNPSKEIIWIVQRDSTIKNKSGSLECLWTNYGIYLDGTENPITNSQLFINGNKLIDSQNSNYFNYYVPYNCHTRTPVDGINCYSFSLMPEENQPSGSCNMSRLTSFQLSLSLDKKMLLVPNRNIQNNNNSNNCSNNNTPINLFTDVPELLHIKIFSISQNILRIIGGMGGLAFT